MTYIFAVDQPLIVKHLTKVIVRKSGYDKHKNYWGVGYPVWTYELTFERTNRRFYADTAVRAKNKTEAKKKIRAMFPSVKRFIS